MNELLRRWYPQALLGSLCIGLAAANAARPGAWLAGAAALAGLGSVAVRPELRVPFLAAALAAAGWSWGAARLDDLDRSALLPHVDETARATAVVTAPPRHGMYSIRVPVEVRRFGRLSVRERVLLELPPGRAPPQGAILEVIGSLELPPTSDSGFDERTWLRRQGIAVVLDGKVWRQVGRRGGLGGVADGLRRHIERTLAPGVGGERGAVLAGVVLGADEGLSPELRDAFRASGLYHLLAVSGQNVVFIAIGVLAAAWLLGAPRWLGEIGVLGSIASYTLAVGWQPSVVRAAVAGGVASLAWLAARPRDRWYALLLVRGCPVGVEPVRAPRSRFRALVRRGLGDLRGRATAPASAGGLPRPAAAWPRRRGLGRVQPRDHPILWLRFGAVPVYSVPANAMAELSVGPMLGLGLVSSVLHPLVPSASAAIGWLAGWPAAYLAFCARLWASLPGAQITSGKALAGLVLVAALLGVAVRRSMRSAGAGTPPSADEPEHYDRRVAQDLKPAYLLVGGDGPKIARALERLRARVGEDNVEHLSAREAGGADAVAACNAMGLFAGGDGRLVLVGEVEAWKAADVKEVAAYLDAPAPDAVLALTGDVKADSALGKAVAKRGEVLVYDVTAKALPRWVAEQFARLGANADAGACSTLIELIGDEPDELAAEVDKLAVWAAGEPIQARDVLDLVAGRAETSIFSLTDSWGRRDLAAALGASEELLARSDRSRRDELLRLAGLLANHVARVRRCQSLAEEGVRPREAASA